MEFTASLRLPLQSPPVHRGSPGGHQHPGGIEAAQGPCDVAGVSGKGTCLYPDGSLFEDNVSCLACCIGTPLFQWVSKANPNVRITC